MVLYTLFSSSDGQIEFSCMNNCYFILVMYMVALNTSPKEFYSNKHSNTACGDDF